jgi:hypothetical protein
MVVLLNDETLEPSLPDMSIRPEMFMISADMACHEPLHPLTQVLCFFRRYQQMKMIWYQAIGIQFDREPLDGLQKQFLKSTIIRRVVKHLLTAIASVDYVVKQAIS